MRDLLTVLNPDAENLRNSLYIKFRKMIKNNICKFLCLK